MREGKRVAGVDWSDLKSLHGDYDLGFNATGVIETSLHVRDDEIIVRESMPGHHVQTIMDEVAAFADTIKKRRPGGHIAGKIPFTLWRVWRKQWEDGPKQHGMLWRAFFSSKFYDADYSKFRVRV
ncbi:MAG: hypothetical protein WC790_00390 [Candidatus Paceibacterota bacterium]|jgi:hypothetical protein